MNEQLITIKDKNILQVFTQDKGLDPYVEMIKKEVREFNHDLDTDKGRKATASLAAKVARSKTYLDGLGKALVSDWKAKAKVVDGSRKIMRDQLDELKKEARKPLDEWEALEEKKIKAEKERLEKEKLSIQFENDHEFALLLNKQHDQDVLEKIRIERKAEEEHKRIADIKQKERDERIAGEARESAEKEKIEAEARAKQAEIDKIQAQKQAKIDAELAEKAAKEAEDRRLKDIKEAEDRSRIAEKKRIDEEKRLEKEKKEKLEANKRHVGKVRGEIKDHLIQSCGLDNDLAKKVVIALTKTNRVTINY